MKKILIITTYCLANFAAQAQKCLQIDIVTSMSKLHAPGSAQQSFSEAATKKGDKGMIIVDYGAVQKQLDDFMKNTALDFERASVTGNGAAIPDMGNAQATAAKMQGMTPAQQQAYAMQIAAQMQNSAGKSSAPKTDDPASVKLAMQTADIGGRQMSALVDEFSQKLRQLNDEEDEARKNVRPTNTEKCRKNDKTGSLDCHCVDGLEVVYYGQLVAIDDSYGGRKAALMQSYLVRLKALAGMVDDNVSKLKYGDALNSAQYKRILLGAQSSAFSNAFSAAGAIIEEVRKSGADDYINEYNYANYLNCN